MHAWRPSRSGPPAAIAPRSRPAYLRSDEAHRVVTGAPSRPAPSRRPGGPGIARRLYEAVRTCRSSPRTATSRDSARGRPVRGPGLAADLPRPLRHPAAARQRRPARTLGVGRRDLEADARAAWRLLCAHWTPSAAPRAGTGSRAELADIFGVTVRPSAATADTIYDQVAGTRHPPSGRARCWSGSGSRSWRPRTTPATTWPTGPSPRATWRPGSCRPSGPTATSSPAAPTGATRRPARRRGRHRHRRLRGVHRRRWRARRHFVEHGAVSADHSHADVRTARGPEEPSGSRAARTGRRHRPRRPRCAATCSVRWRGCRGRRPGDDPPPRGAPQPPRPDAPGSARTPARDIPTAWSSPAGSSRCWSATAPPRLPPRAVHPRRDACSREIAPLAGFYPASTPGAPWWFLDAPAAIRRYRRP